MTKVFIALLFLFVLVTSSKSVYALPAEMVNDPNFSTIEELVEWIETIDAARYRNSRFEECLLSTRYRGKIFAPVIDATNIRMTRVTATPQTDIRRNRIHYQTMMLVYEFASPEVGQILVRTHEVHPERAIVYETQGIVAYLLSMPVFEGISLQIGERDIVVISPQTGMPENVTVTYAYMDRLDQVDSMPTAAIIFVLDGREFRITYRAEGARHFINNMVWEIHPITYRPHARETQSTLQHSNATPTTPHPTRNTIRFTIASPTYTINTTPHTTDAPPFLCPAYNRTMLPLRTVSEALGTEVDWIPESRTVQIFTQGGIHEIAVDMPLPNNMGTPVLIQDRVFVPLRYIAELLNATPRWDGDNMAAYVYQYVVQG